MKVDFVKVREVSLEWVIALYGIEAKKRSNTELVANCPFPSHTSEAHKWTLAISLEKNKWYCHSDTCRSASNKPKGGDVIDFVCLMDNTLPLDAAKKLSSLFLTSDGEGERRVKSAAKPEPEATGNKALAFELKKLDPNHPEILKKISLETAAAFGIGFHAGKGSMAQRICFPLWENGSLVGYAGRATLDGQDPKWLVPVVHTFLYGLERCSPEKPLILCESCWGVPYFHQHQHQAAALLGSSLTEAQERLLDPFPVIHLCMDNDDAGRTAAEKIGNRLKAKHKVFKAFLNE